MYEGAAILSAFQVVMKGLLEAELEVSLVCGPRQGSFGGVFNVAAETANLAIIRQHGIRVTPTPDAVRGLTLATQAARSGRAAISLLPNIDLDDSIAVIRNAMSEPFDRGGAMGILLEDSPRSSPASCPRQTARRLGLPCIEPADLSQLRQAMDIVLRLSRAGRCPVGVVVHDSILHMAQTLEMLPNRVQTGVDAALARRKRLRGTRVSEAGGALRMARRLDLNRVRGMPSPGERVPVGFVVVGPADGAVRHLTNIFVLYGRIPVLQLGLIQPVDEPAVERLLARCQQVIVLEPRPGSTEPEILAVAEGMRRRGESPATIWGRSIPPAPGGTPLQMRSDEDLHPSILVRKIAHLLHDIRPTVQVASQLLPEPPAVETRLPPREAQIGAGAAMIVVRRLVTDVDQWLRDRTPEEGEAITPSALAIDGAETPGVTGRIVNVETWSHGDFQADGPAAVVQASFDERPCIFLICEDAGGEISDLERLARGVIPAARADRVTIQTANLVERSELRDRLREAALEDRFTIIIVRDGPPPRYNVAAIEELMEEIDRLGFEPRQRLVRSADDVCALRPSAENLDAERAGPLDPDPLQTEFLREEVVRRRGVRWKVQPLWEEVEVIRTRPPLRAWRSESSVRPNPPQPIHARQPAWRGHLAGFRDEPPGPAAWVLSDAGRRMGYHVQSIWNDAPIGAGRRAWTQILFTHPRSGQEPADLPATIPYGEADLLLGLDPRETLRAIGPDPILRVAFAERTGCIANRGAFSEELDTDAASTVGEAVPLALVEVTMHAGRIIDDFAGACRLWFHTDRVADMALLGAAYQQGFVPVSAEAIDAAISAAEARGFGRCHEAFDFGRQLAVEPRLFTRPKDDREEDVQQLARRMALSLSRRRFSSSKRARVFARLVQSSLDAMPGLAETDLGRAARRDFVVACHRCVTWGGYEYAQQYANLIVSLYQADRGERGRALTRSAILPLAEAMLIRDPLYIAGMACSPEQRRRTRLRLNVKLARDDRIERRYLTRLEVIAAGRRFRADVRTSDWPARAVASLRRVVPARWRGTPREREARDSIINLIQRASFEGANDYDRWLERLTRLHNHAADNRLRGMALAELKMLIGD